jgi:hypothetical protein
MNAEETYKDYPSAASKNAQKAIDWKEEYGRDVVTAGTAVGWQRAHQLAKGEALSQDVVSRMAQFNRHRKNSTIAPEFKDEPWKDKGYVSWLIWGGDEGVDWAMETMDKIKAEEKVTEWFDAYESFLEECESTISYIEFLNEGGDPKALSDKLLAIRQSMKDTRDKVSDLRLKMRDAAQDKEKPWKAQIVGLDIKKNELKLQVLSLDDISTRLKLQHVNDSVVKNFKSFISLKESNKVPKFK